MGSKNSHRRCLAELDGIAKECNDMADQIRHGDLIQTGRFASLAAASARAGMNYMDELNVHTPEERNT